MSDTPTIVPTEQTRSDVNTRQQAQADPVDVFLRGFGEAVGKEVGVALAEEIHADPEVRRAAATGAGVGLGVVGGLALLALLTQ